MQMNLRFHPIAWCVIVGTVLSRGVFYMVYPYLAIYLHRVVGLDAATIGVILGMSSLIGTCSSFFGGVLSDRFGRYPVMILSILLWGLVFIGFANGKAAWMFFLLNACNGLFRYLFETASRALLSDVTPQEESLSVFSARYYAINIGAAIGPLLGAYFGSSNSVTPFYLTALIYALYGCGILFLRLRYGSEKKVQVRVQGEVKGEVLAKEVVTLKQAFKIIATDRFFRYFLIGNMFVCTAYAHLETTLPQYMGNAPAFADGVKLFSYMMMANALAVLALQIPVTRWAKRFQPITCVKIGGVLFALSVLGFGLFTSIVPLVLSMVLFSVGEILCFVLGDVVIDHHAPVHLRGTYFGASGLQFLGQSAGPWIGGMLLNWLGYQQGPLMFAILMGITILSVPMFQLSDRIKRRQAQEQPLDLTTAESHTV
jgi:MFS family permease